MSLSRILKHELCRCDSELSNFKLYANIMWQEFSYIQAFREPVVWAVSAEDGATVTVKFECIYPYPDEIKIEYVKVSLPINEPHGEISIWCNPKCLAFENRIWASARLLESQIRLSFVVLSVHLYGMFFFKECNSCNQI